MSCLLDRVGIRTMCHPHIAGVALGVALIGTVVGCASSPNNEVFSSTQYQSSQAVGPVTEYDYEYSGLTDGQYVTTQAAGGEAIRVSVADHSSMQGQTDAMDSYFSNNAEANNLAAQFLSEAQIGMTQIQATLADARAAEIDRDAMTRAQRAQLDTSRAEAKSEQDSSMAAIEEIKEHQEARKAELVAQLASRERQMKATVDKNAMFATALAKEKRTAQQDIISLAEQEFAEARAQIEQLRVVSQATEMESHAVIDQLKENVEATRKRGGATVAQLRQEARSVSDKTTAKISNLTTLLATVPRQYSAEASQLKALAVSIEDGTRASAMELEARATSLEKQVAVHRYNLMLTTAKARRQQAQASADRKNTEASMAFERSTAQVQRLRGDAHKVLQDAQSDGSRQTGELNAWYRRQQAEIGKLRSAADRAEKVARAEFVKALTRHQADAARETAKHQNVLSEENMKSTIAKAKAQAAEVHNAILNEMVKQTRIGSPEFPGKTTAVNQRMDLDVPMSAKVAAVAKRVNPNDLAEFRSSLAKVLHDRTTADTQLAALDASFDEQKTNVEAVRDQKIAVGNEQIASADAIHLQAVASLAEQNSNVTAGMANARSAYDLALVEAESTRMDALAQVTELRAIAKANRLEGEAKADALHKEAQMTMANGQNEIDALQAAMQATEEQGEATTSRLLAQAQSVEQSEAALAEQIESQIAMADSELVAELAQLERAIESGITVAEANYVEMLAEAESVGLQAEMEIKRLFARNELERALAQAEIARLHDVHFTDSIRAEALVDRYVAETLAERSYADAIHDANSVRIGTEFDKTSATITALRGSAAARANFFKTRFNSRITEADSERIKAKAAVLVKSMHEQANAKSILAEARAARGETKKRLARLVKHQEALQRAAVKDWDSRLYKNPSAGFNPN